MPENWIDISSLSFSRGPRLIPDNIYVSAPKGKITAIMDPSGCGKTTLLRLIGCRLRTAAVSIRVDNIDITALNRKELFGQRRRMGMLFQTGALFTDLSVFENVAFALRVYTALRGAYDLIHAELPGAGRAAVNAACSTCNVCPGH